MSMKEAGTAMGTRRTGELKKPGIETYLFSGSEFMAMAGDGKHCSVVGADGQDECQCSVVGDFWRLSP
ncbi:hypothetical protein DM860_002149 [Cuscuta australis]|uniref:Uncharacterized protein n=1 Tax=Cuscuta australis TaxID=267555 RepID=A0A328DZE2_9ASTE|nr:hypothetical protein DM860_002149 [Cuscuta australis]